MSNAPGSKRIRVVPLVKAYPEPSQRYGETVCVAGVRTDVDPNCWVRLWPIDFRGLSFDEQFHKYEEIELDVLPATNDRRPESCRPVEGSIAATGRVFGTDRGWAARWQLIEPLLVPSMCELMRMQESEQTSLGAFRPFDVRDVTFEPTKPYSERQLTALGQRNLFAQDREMLERMPWAFKYKYRCADAACNGHEQTIVDWEIAQAWRRWRRDLGDDESTKAAIRTKWLDELCATDRDTVFFAGNMWQRPSQFLTLGVFWPPQGSQRVLL